MRNVLFFICLLSFYSSILFGTDVDKNITTNTTWTTSESPYNIKKDIYIRDGATLTIQTGVTVNFENDYWELYVGYSSSSTGTLVANGVSFKGLDTYDSEIHFNEGSAGTISNCTFDHMIIEIEETSIDLSNNQFSNCEYPIELQGGNLEISGTTFGTGVEYPGIAINTVSSAYYDTDQTLKNFGMPYYINNNLYIRSGATLTFASGSEVHFVNDGWELYVGSSSSSTGTLVANGVSFKGLDTYDSEIHFNEGSAGTISNCTFDHMIIEIEETSIDLSNNQFSNCEYPIELQGGNLEISGTTFGTGVEYPGIAINTVSFAYYDTDQTLKNFGMPYYVNNNLYIRSGATLTFASGTEVHFVNDGWELYVGSSSSSTGTLVANGVSFKGLDTYDSEIHFNEGSAGTISNCTFNHMIIEIEETSIDLSNNQFSNCEYPIELQGGNLEISGTTFGTGVEYPGIAINTVSFAYYDTDQTLKNFGMPYYVNNNLYIRSGATLTFASGAEVQLPFDNYEINVGSSSSNTGTLIADGVDFKGLDTQDSEIHFNEGSGGTISNCTFDHMRVEIDNASPELSYSRFYHCNNSILITSNSNPIISNNDFYNNEYAIKNEGTNSIDAKFNFWGHQSGPIHSLNINGLGETLEGDIDFSSFLIKPKNGIISGKVNESNYNFGSMVTGLKKDTVFTLINQGTEDLLVTKISNRRSNISVNSPDRFWLYPDSSKITNFSFTSLNAGLQNDTIDIYINDALNPKLQVFITADGIIENINFDFHEIDIDSFPNVNCYFTITDQANIPITGLNETNFTIYEDDNHITNFDVFSKSNTTETVVASLVIDKSGSMAGQRLRDAKNASMDFVNELSPGDKASVISFNSKADIEQDFTNDKDLLINAINSINASGGTHIFDAIDVAIGKIKTEKGRKAIIVSTDGRDSGSLKSPEDIIASANEQAISIYTIGLGSESDSTLQNIAYQTGGEYYYAPTSEDLSIIYLKISGQLQNQYTISFLSPDTSTSSFNRTLLINVDYAQKSTSDTINYNINPEVVDNILEAMSVAFEKKLNKRNKLYKSNSGYFNYDNLKQDYANKIKHYGFISLGFFEILEASMFVDLDDYIGISEEGKDGWVTVYFNVGYNIGLGLLPFDFGLVNRTFDPIEPDVPREFEISQASGSIGLKIAEFNVDEGKFDVLNIDSETFQVSLNPSVSMGGGSWNFFRKEIRREVLDGVLVSSFDQGHTGPLFSINKEKVRTTFLSHIFSLGITTFIEIYDPSNYRPLTPGDNSEMAHTDGMIEFCRGGIDDNEDGIMDNLFPGSSSDECQYTQVIGWTLHIHWRNVGNSTDDFYIKVNDIPTGWSVRSIYFNEYYNGRVIYPYDKYKSKDIAPNEEVWTTWTIKKLKSGVEEPVIKFTLHQNNFFGEDPVLDEVIVKLNSYYENILVVTGQCPIELEIVNPLDSLINKESLYTPNFRYFNSDVDSDGTQDVQITIAKPLIGEYKIYVKPTSEALPSDIFTLSTFDGKNVVTLAENTKIEDIPSNPYSLNVTTIKTEYVNNIPDNYSLTQNYPNPFNSITTISFALIKDEYVILTLYDILGNKICNLTDGQFNTGVHKFTFNLNSLSSGTYYYNLKAGKFSSTKKLVLLK